MNDGHTNMISINKFSESSVMKERGLKEGKPSESSECEKIFLKLLKDIFNGSVKQVQKSQNYQLEER